MGGRNLWRATFAHPVALLDAVRPQVVGVVVPPDAHHLVTAVAAARGAHIITETPIATTLAMADHMLASAERHNVLLEVSENVWRWPRERLKRLVVEQGLLGQVTQVHLWYTSGRLSRHGRHAPLHHEPAGGRVGHECARRGAAVCRGGRTDALAAHLGAGGDRVRRW